MSADDNKAKSDAPSGEEESQEQQGEEQQGKDKHNLPPYRVNEIVEKAVERTRAELTAAFNARLATQAAEIETLKNAKPKQQPETPQYTRAQLNAAVEAGTLTQEVADQLWENQVEARITKRVETKVVAQATEQQREQAADRGLAEYQGLVPDAWVPGTDDRKAVDREFTNLLGLGFPRTKATELAALRAAFGDPEALRRSREAGRRGPADTHQETGGASGRRRQGGDGDDGGEDAPPSNLTPHQREHYNRAIQNGVYASWKDVKAELKFAGKPRVH